MVQTGKKKCIGYILRKFPVFSETFILNEILELEAKGQEVHIFSVERPNDPKFHKNLYKLKAHVTYIPDLLKLPTLLKHRKRAFKTFGNNCRKALFYTALQGRPPLFLRLLQSSFVANEAKKKGIEHFHAHFATRATTVAFFASMMTGIPYSFTAHAVDIFKETLSKKALKEKILRAAFVVAVSDYNKNYLQEICKGSKESIFKINNGIDLDFFCPLNEEKKEPFTFLSVARFVEKKGHKVLIEALEILKRENVCLQCFLVGHGALQKSLEETIKEKKLEDIVKIVGPCSQDEVLSWFQRSHSYILPCTTGNDGNKDGLPVAIVEALSCGIPVITTPMTGNPEVVKHCCNGLFIPFDHPQKTAAAMKRLVEDKKLYQTLSCNARASVEKEFDIKRTVKMLSHKFEESFL